MKMKINIERHMILSKKNINKEIKELVKIREEHQEQYQSILQEVKEQMNKWKIEHNFVDENGNLVKKFRGQYHREWSFEKQIMKEKFDVDQLTTQDLNPGVRFN